MRRPDSSSSAVTAGLVAALVGFTSSFAVVLAGLRAVGASPAQAASGLLVLCVTQGLGMLWLTRRHRLPLTLAWSTPGAALLVSAGVPDGGWPAAVGAFLVTGGLFLLTALWPRLGTLIARIPTPVAQAMLAGVLLPLCLAPVAGLVERPWLVAPVVLTWLALQRLAPRWSVPAAFAVALVVLTSQGSGTAAAAWAPQLSWTAPHLSAAAVVGIAVPLYVVTMASQNVPGVAVMASYGYTVPWRESMTVTGVGTVTSAFAGGHAVNLAAITAALAASPDAHPDPQRRWVAASTAGWAYLALAVLSAGLTALASAGPAGVLEAVAGLALLSTLASALGSSLGASASTPGHREAAVVTLVVAASGVTLVGVGAAFWALLAGLVVLAVLRLGKSSEPTGPAGASQG